MWIYQASGSLYGVGYILKDAFVNVELFDSIASAATRCHYLNGGSTSAVLKTIVKNPPRPENAIPPAGWPTQPKEEKNDR